MSYRKTKLIQERNLILERKYVLEQAPPSPPAPMPSGGTTGTTIGSGVKEFTKDQINKATDCSNFKVDESKFERKEQEIDGIIYVYYLTQKKDVIFCKAESKPKESK